MRPRLIAVDDFAAGRVGQRGQLASMRPRLIAVDDEDERVRAVRQAAASMRPRLIAVDDALRAKIEAMEKQLQ